AVGTTDKVFFCPSRRLPQTVSVSYAEYLGGRLVTHALCDYAAANFHTAPSKQTGVVRQFYPVRIAEITDGTSNTLMVADKRLNLDYLGQPQEFDSIGYSDGWDGDVDRTTDRPPKPDYHGISDRTKRFGSSHTGRFNAVFADGSVRPISY